jgi:hypothetical protein
MAGVELKISKYQRHSKSLRFGNYKDATDLCNRENYCRTYGFYLENFSRKCIFTVNRECMSGNLCYNSPEQMDFNV